MSFKSDLIAALPLLDLLRFGSSVSFTLEKMVMLLWFKHLDHWQYVMSSQVHLIKDYLHIAIGSKQQRIFWVMSYPLQHY
jgi:hypothetical protein